MAIKQWGIRVHDSGWLQISDHKNKFKTKDAIYYSKSSAVEDAKEFNSLHKNKIYTVKEYK